jgi:hypothetical protein
MLLGHVRKKTLTPCPPSETFQPFFAINEATNQTTTNQFALSQSKQFYRKIDTLPRRTLTIGQDRSDFLKLLQGWIQQKQHPAIERNRAKTKQGLF